MASLTDNDEAAFRHGRAVAGGAGVPGATRVYGRSGAFLGLADRDAGGVLRPRRVVRADAPANLAKGPDSQ
jgi:hypothetical protein